MLSERAQRASSSAARPQGTRRRLLALAVLGVLGACATGTPQVETEPRSGEAFAPPVLLPVADDPTVSFAVWFDVGSADDPVGKEGLASVTGNLIAQGGTAARSFEEILAALYPLASAYQVRVDKEMTTLTGRTHVDNVAAFLDLFTDAYLRPAFRPEDFERVRSDHLNYLQNTLRYSSDEELGKAALTWLVFEGTRYAHPVQGTVQGLQAITLADVHAFYRRYYTGANTVVALGGGYAPEVLARFQATLAELPRGEAPETPLPEPREIDGREVLLVAKPQADASISFGFPLAVRRGDEDFYPLWLANSWLGEHRNSSSHLYGVIREARGLNYGDYSYLEAFPEGGQRQMPPPNVGRSRQLFEVWIRTLPNEQGVFALRAALRELDRLVADELGEDDFALTRRFLSKYYLHFAETTQARLGFAVDDRYYGLGGTGHLARFGREIEGLDRETVNAAVRRHLQTADVAIAIVTGDADGLRETLTTGAPTPIEYPTEKPPEVLEEDVEIARFPLRVPAEKVRVVPVEEMFEK